MANPQGPWVIHVCPLCGMQVFLNLRRAEDVQCYGFAGNHPGTQVKTIMVVPEPTEQGGS